jgi:uncharacterized protein (TIGR02001 family)
VVDLAARARSINVFEESNEMKRSIGAVALVAILATPLVGMAQEAELSANAGWASQYYYRGLLIKESSASAGLDLAVSDFSLGTWAADVGDGVEADLYASYGVALTDQVSVSLGGTGYFYSGQADDTYLEGNLGIGVGPLSVDYAIGQYRTGAPHPKYSFLSVTGEYEGLFATVGTSAYAADLSDALSDPFKRDSGLQYVEAGYGFTAAELDFLVSAIWNDAVLSGELDGAGAPTHEVTLVFGVSKTFDIDIN